MFFFFFFFFFFQAEDGIRDGRVTGVQTCALPISGVGTVSRYTSAPRFWLVELEITWPRSNRPRTFVWYWARSRTPVSAPRNTRGRVRQAATAGTSARAARGRP